MKLGKLLILVLTILCASQLIGQNAFLPYAQNFDESSSLPAGWSVIKPENGWNGLSVYGYYCQSGPNCLYYWSESCTATDCMLGIAPAVDWDYYPDATLTFSAGMYTQGVLCPVEVGYMTDASDSTTYVPLSTFNLSTAYQQFTVDLSALTGTSHLCFRFVANNNQQGMFLDDVLINIASTPFMALPYTQNFDAALTLPAGWGQYIHTEGVDASITVTAGQSDSAPNNLTFWCSALTGENTDIKAILPAYDIYEHPTPYLSFSAKTNSNLGLMPKLEVGFTDPANPESFTLLRSWRLDNHYMDYVLDLSEFRSASVLVLRFCPTQANQYVYVDDVSVLAHAPTPVEPPANLTTLPFYENFDSYDWNTPIPNGWNRIFTAGEGQGYASIYGSYGTSQPNCLYFWNSAPETQQPRIAAIMPGVDTTVLSGVNWYFTAGGYSETTMPALSVGYFTDPNDISTFQYIETVTLTQQPQAYTYNLSAPGGIVYFAYVMEPTGMSQGMSIDDIALTVEPYYGPYVTVPYRENFDYYGEYGFPTGWGVFVNSENWSGQVYLSNNEFYSSPNSLSMSNSSDTTATSYWMGVGPCIRYQDMGGNSLHFRAKGIPGEESGPIPHLAVGYLLDRLNPASFQTVEEIVLTDSYEDYEVTIPADASYELRPFAFKLIPTAQYQDVRLDDVYFGVTSLYDYIDLPYVQNFDSCNHNDIPPDWRMLLSSTDPEAQIRTNDNYYISDENCLEMNNGTDTSSDSYWIAATPAVRSTQLGNCLVKFYAMGYDSDYEETPELTFGYLTDRTDASTFVSLQTLQLSDDFDEFTIPIVSPTRLSQIFFAFRMDVTGEYQTLCIEDVRIESMGSSARLLPFYEDFENLPFPSDGWKEMPVDLGTENDTDVHWSRYEDSFSGRIRLPDVYQGTGMAVFSKGTAGNSSRLTTPFLDLRGAGQITVSFAVAHIDSYTSSQYDNEGIQLQVSLDGIRWTNIGEFIRRADPDAMGYDWENYALDVTNYAGNPAVRFGLLGTTMNGMNIYVDQFQVVGASGLGVPQNLEAIVSAGYIALEWDAVDAAGSYIVYSSTSPEGPFTEDLTGTYWGNGWSTNGPVTGKQKFYQVKASTVPYIENAPRGIRRK